MPDQPVDRIVVNYVASRGFTACVKDTVGVGADPQAAIRGMFDGLVRKGGILHLNLEPTYTQAAVDAMMRIASQPTIVRAADDDPCDVMG